MFIQVIEGRVHDAADAIAAVDRWYADVRPNARGWLGLTLGVTGDDTLVNIVRFESEQAARENSDRPEQQQWWTETSEIFTEEPTFYDCTDVEQWLGGGSDDAGFVQVIQGRLLDPERFKQVNHDLEVSVASLRPEIIGGTVALTDDGQCIQTVYFTSEEAAREGESKEPPPEIAAAMETWRGLYDGEPIYFDLRDPRMYSA
ncbi:MAG TPA: hypothetical protein VFZ37_19000 [Jiangellaceae bacterium]